METQSAGKNIILSSIGDHEDLDDCRQTFCLDGAQTDAVHSTLALAALLTDRGDSSLSFKPVFISPSGVTVNEQKLHQEAERVGVDLPLLIDRSELNTDRWLYLRPMMKLIGDSTCVFDLTTMDSMLASTAVCYSSFHRMMSKSSSNPEVFIGQQKGPDDPVVEFINPEHLLDLPGWSVSLEALVQDGNSGPLARRLEQLHDESYTTDELPESHRLQQLSRMVDGTYNHLTSALPVEAGRYRHDHDQPFWMEVEQDLQQLSPFLRRMLDPLKHRLGDAAMHAIPDDKIEVELDEEELSRQLRLARRLSETGNVLPGFLLARELLVNGAMLKDSDRLAGEVWLDGEERSRAAAPFYLLNHWMQYDDLRGLLSDRQRRVAKVWGGIKQRRNELAHAGFCSDSIPYRRLKEELEERLEAIEDLVLEQRSLLSSLLDFDHTGQVVLVSIPNREDKHRVQVLLKTMLDQLAPVSKLIGITGDDEKHTGRLDAVRTAAEACGVRFEVRHVPRGRNGVEQVESFWEDHRRDLLQNASVTAVQTCSSPVLNHVVRELYQRVCQFGIAARLLAVEERISEREVDDSAVEPITIDQFQPSSTARSR